MAWLTTWRFLKHWVQFTVRDTIAQLFGWLAAAGGIVGGFLPKIGVNVVPYQFAEALETIVIACVIGLCFYAAVGYRKALHHVHPIVVSIADGLQSPDLSFNDGIRGYAVAAVVQNRSEAHLLDCVMHVMNAPGFVGGITSRFVEKFDLPPHSRKTVQFAYWSSREPPNVDDRDIGLSGPPGGCFDGNVCRTPASGADLHIRIQSADSVRANVWCRVWIEAEARRLRAQQLPRASVT